MASDSKRIDKNHYRILRILRIWYRLKTSDKNVSPNSLKDTYTTALTFFTSPLHSSSQPAYGFALWLLTSASWLLPTCALCLPRLLICLPLCTLSGFCLCYWVSLTSRGPLPSNSWAQSFRAGWVLYIFVYVLCVGLNSLQISLGWSGSCVLCTRVP